MPIQSYEEPKIDVENTCEQNFGSKPKISTRPFSALQSAIRSMELVPTDGTPKQRSNFSPPVVYALFELIKEPNNLSIEEIGKKLQEVNSSWVFPEKKLVDKIAELKKTGMEPKSPKPKRKNGPKEEHEDEGLSPAIVSRPAKESIEPVTSTSSSAWKFIGGNGQAAETVNSPQVKKRKAALAGVVADAFDTESDDEGMVGPRATPKTKVVRKRAPKATSSMLAFSQYPILIKKDFQFYVVNKQFQNTKLAILYVMRRIGRDDLMTCKLSDDRRTLVIETIFNKFSFTGLPSAAYKDSTLQELQYAFSVNVAEPAIVEDTFNLPMAAHAVYPPRREEFAVDNGKIVYLEIVLSNTIGESVWKAKPAASKMDGSEF